MQLASHLASPLPPQGASRRHVLLSPKAPTTTTPPASSTTELTIYKANLQRALDRFTLPYARASYGQRSEHRLHIYTQTQI